MVIWMDTDPEWSPLSGGGPPVEFGLADQRGHWTGAAYLLPSVEWNQPRFWVESATLPQEGIKVVPVGALSHMVLPMWYLVIPLGLLSVWGFRLRRHGCSPNQCRGCRHPLAGAAVCPECGTPAPAAAA